MTQEREQAAKSRPMITSLEGVPLPDLVRLPDYEQGFWEGTRNGELRIQQCSDCGFFRHLPMPMCPDCSSLDYGWTMVSGRGRIYSYVIVRHPVHPAIAEKEQVPYNICMIELEEQEGLRLCSNVLNVAPEDICIDMPVQVVFFPAVDDPNVVLPVFLLAPEQ
jgi:uncharacterized OB-fold protein